MTGADQPEERADPGGLETNPAKLYELAVTCFNRGAYGYTLQLLGQVSKLNPGYEDREDLRTRVALALDQQQRDLVFQEAKAEAERALEQRRWDEIDRIVTAMNNRLEAENLSLTEDQRVESNRWTVTSLRGHPPRRNRSGGQRLFKPTTAFQQPASGGAGDAGGGVGRQPGWQSGSTNPRRIGARPTVAERVGAMPRFLFNAVRDYINEEAWIPILFLGLFLAWVALMRIGLFQ